MKKFSPLIASTLLVGCIALAPSTAAAQADAQAEFERAWYSICYDKQKSDVEKCYQQSKELVEKYPKSTYRPAAEKNIKAYEEKKALDKFQAALKAYYPPNTPDVAKLDQLFTASEEYLKLEPGQQYVIGQMALAGVNGAMGAVGYKDLDRVKGYAEAALKAFEPAAPPTGWEKKDWDSLRDLVIAKMNQYLGWRLIIPTQGDQNLALEYLAKAIQVKGREGIGWKDPYNYVLRTTVYNNQYIEMKKPYDEMTDEQKVSDAGKEILKKVNELLDTKLIPEYARVLATATTNETKPYYDEVKPTFDVLWKFRTEAPEKAADYIKNYVADPTIAPAPIPVKSEDVSGANAPAAPTTSSAKVKMQPGQPEASSGAKSAPAKGKTQSGARGKRRGRG